MIVFEKSGPENTDEAINIALTRAALDNLPVVVATSTGASAARVSNAAVERGFNGHIVAVTHVNGMRTPGQMSLLDEHRDLLLSRNVDIVTATHLLSGVERAMSSTFSGVYPVEIIAHSLRMISAGVKVAVEISCMALDAAKLPYGQPVIAIAGSGGGADTVTLLTPSHGSSLFKTRIHEILCKPY